DLNSLIKAVKSLHKLELMGLMTILPIIPKKPASYWFKQMQELQAPEYKELSMGMSEDFEEAIACGATWVRVGSALFGPRPPDLSCWPTPASLR
ncbi:MAG: alanine racemase, partial [Deltaproteobacteria bacterium]|nr:alanine racemase [Deltaproteobacteria bacterium]